MATHPVTTLFARVLRLLDRIAPPAVAHAHCDLPCGVYDPAQARIEAQSVLKICEKYRESDDSEFRQRCIVIKEQRAELVKHHLMVLWADYFKPHHVERFPELHDRFWEAIKAASEAKKTTDPRVAQACVAAVDEVAEIFWQTDEAKDSGLYREPALAS